MHPLVWPVVAGAAVLAIVGELLKPKPEAEVIPAPKKKKKKKKKELASVVVVPEVVAPVVPIVPEVIPPIGDQLDDATVVELEVPKPDDDAPSD